MLLSSTWARKAAHVKPRKLCLSFSISAGLQIHEELIEQTSVSDMKKQRIGSPGKLPTVNKNLSKLFREENG